MTEAPSRVPQEASNAVEATVFSQDARLDFQNEHRSPDLLPLEQVTDIRKFSSIALDQAVSSLESKTIEHSGLPTPELLKADPCGFALAVGESLKRVRQDKLTLAA